MQRTGGILAVVIALSLGVGLTGCTEPVDENDRASLDAMVEIEKVPGVLVAPYASYIQVDPAASEDQIATTALAVRDILDGMGEQRPKDLQFVAVYPGDGYVHTEFTTRVFDDADRFERDVRVWAGLLDAGFAEVRYNVFDETGDGVLNVHSGEPGRPGPTVTESFDAMVEAVGDDASPELQTEALVGDALATNRSGDPALPAGWADALDQVSKLDFLRKTGATFEPGATALRLTGPTTLTAEQAAVVMSVLTDTGVLQPAVTVTHTSDADKSVTTLYGVAP